MNLKYTKKSIFFFFIKAFMISLTLSLFSNLQANEIGVYGSLYQIAEPDMLSAIYFRLDAMEKNGQINKKNMEFKRRAIAHILRPTPVKGVTDLGSGKPSWHYFNPTIKVNHNIKDTLGRVIAYRGQQLNPLKFIRLSEVLYFIDGDSLKQLEWIKNKIKIADTINKKIKIILVNGNIKTTAKAINNRVYFDQYGKLCSKFNIKHTPTEVYQPVNNGIILPVLMVKEVSDV